MNWLEVSVEAETETAEAVAEVLSRYAHRGVAIEAEPERWNEGSVVVRAYLPVDDQLWDNKRHIKEALGHLNQIRPVPPPTFRTVAEMDWAQEWKKRLTVLHIGEHFVIQPSWLDYTPEPDDVVIQLDPGMAFGTGLHPTTQLCLAAMEKFVHPGTSVLDVGTGSGILAIGAVKLGAGRVLAIDNDPLAVKTARSNLEINQVNAKKKVVSIQHGSLANVTGRYDLIIVNILAKVIVEMLQEGLATRIRPEGKLVASGIIADQTSDVVAAMEQQKLNLVEQQQMEDWVGLIAQPQS